MSHRISKKRAKMLTENELELQQMQHEGKQLPKSRRQKKYELTRRKQDGILWRMKDRIRKTGGKMPDHLKETK